MWTVQWQRSFEGLSLSLESHSWAAGQTLRHPTPHFNIMQACTRRPVRAQLARPIRNGDRLGRLVLTPAGPGVTVETTGEETEFLVRKFEFDTKWLNNLASSCLDFDFDKAQAQPVFDDPVIGATLDRIYTEMMSPGQASLDMLASLVRIFAIDTARLLTMRSKQPSTVERLLTAEQVAHIQRLIETTEFKDLTPGRIAVECQMSLSRLRDAFRRTTGTSLREKIEEARINAACRLLVETGHPLKIIAHRLGFGHASAFCYSFKNATGLTPTEYRLRNFASQIHQDILTAEVGAVGHS